MVNLENLKKRLINLFEKILDSVLLLERIYNSWRIAQHSNFSIPIRIKISFILQANNLRRYKLIKGLI